MTDIIVCTPTTQNIQDVAFKTQNILFLDYDAFWDKVYVCVDKNTYNNKYLEKYA
ncbi:hypothetical protein [uncultured Catenibacterium sp.]|uniref:hypothetical protein n=1 Tax=uncultured Catenibacterium sp. TaxID=286142 RepID=UPI00262A12AA|nr:hypothetical protein [uncultured Catenibacterium sp.]